MLRRTVLVAMALGTGLGCTEPAALLEDHWVSDIGVLMQARPDECFAGIGEPVPSGPPCPAGSVEKINEAYVWGLTEEYSTYFFGTAPNVHCLVIGGFLQFTSPQEVPSWVCEFGESQIAQDLGLPAAVGDWRPPHAYAVDPYTSAEYDLTPDDPLFAQTGGLRSAGSLGGVVILAGPALSAAGGVHTFAWRAKNREYLGSHAFPDYTNIRSWVDHRGVLYTGVRHRDGSGRILRWRGSAQDPFQFEEIGVVDADPAYLSIYQSESGGTHLAITTWPVLQAGGGLPPSASLWVSGEIPPESGVGLTAADAAGFEKRWRYSDYDPDLVTAGLTGGGAAASFDGWHWWGTMHVPFMPAVAYATLPIPGGPIGEDPTPEELLRLILNTWRSVAIFRGRRLETDDPEIELVYGEEKLHAWSFVDQEWQHAPNKMGMPPLYGTSGFGNDYNNYLWVAGVAFKQLFMGTMDFSYLVDALILKAFAANLFGEEVAEGLQQFLLAQDPGFDGEIEIPEEPGPILRRVRGHGADLWRFSDADRPATAAIVDGGGNPLAYGFRSMIARRWRLVLGTANPMNLETEGERHGGWEVLNVVDP
jgi:hypothetical protein